MLIVTEAIEFWQELIYDECMPKGFALIPLVIVVMLLGVGGFYFLSKYQSTTSNNSSNKTSTALPQIKKDSLNTYTKDDFQFEYSNDLIVKEDSEQDFNKRGNGNFRKNFTGYVQYEPGKFLEAVAVLDKDSSYDKNPVTLWVFDNPQDLSIDTWYKNYWYYPFVWGDFTYEGKVKLSPTNESTISGQIAKSGVVDYQPGKPKFVYLSKDKKMYLFRIIGESGDKILQTFKFN